MIIIVWIIVRMLYDNIYLNIILLCLIGVVRSWLSVLEVCFFNKVILEIKKIKKKIINFISIGIIFVKKFVFLFL